MPTITLRPLKACDLKAFWTWASDPEVTRWLTWEAHTDKQQSIAFLKTVVAAHPCFMAVCLDGVPVGSITLDRGQGMHAVRAEMGYCLARAWWGQGVMSEAARQMIARGFADPALQRIEATVDPENVGSQRVLERAGMTREGLLRRYVQVKGQVRDRLLYAVTR